MAFDVCASVQAPDSAVELFVCIVSISNLCYIWTPYPIGPIFWGNVARVSRTFAITQNIEIELQNFLKAETWPTRPRPPFNILKLVRWLAVHSCPFRDLNVAIDPSNHVLERLGRLHFQTVVPFSIFNLTFVQWPWSSQQRISASTVTGDASPAFTDI